MANFYEMKVSQIKDKKYIPLAKGIIFLLLDEMIDLVNMVQRKKN